MFEDLTILHWLKLVHADIKPENMMFSPAYKKTVFIDFGLSSFVREELGQLTKT